MKINGVDRCISCMKPLVRDGICSHCHFPQTEYRPAPRCLRPGCLLSGRYVLGKVLGEGSFGITYIAWDALLDTVVAVKEYFPNGTVSRHVGDGNDFNIYLYEKREKRNYRDDLEKYLQEAKRLCAFAELDGIVSVRDFFYENQTAYIVMSFVDGISLKEYVEENGRIEGGLFLEMLRPLLVSLSKVHETGMLHRDISPDNILVTEKHKLVLVDFGAARRENIDLSHSMTVVFKRGYSPEEQYRTRGKQGAWTDIYALCATAYYALTGIRPDEAIERLLEDELRPLTDLIDLHLPDAQKKAFMKGMAVQPEERYQSVQALYDALYGIREATAGRRRWNRKTAALTVCLLTVVILFGLWQGRKLMAGTMPTVSGTEAVDHIYNHSAGLTDAAGQADMFGTGRKSDKATEGNARNTSCAGISEDGEE